MYSNNPQLANNNDFGFIKTQKINLQTLGTGAIFGPKVPLTEKDSGSLPKKLSQKARK